MDWTFVYVLAGVVLNALIFGVWKPWTQGYAREKSKNFARMEDLNEILAEVRAVTITQKEIESKLSGDLWNRQMQWNEKKAVYGSILTVIHEMQASCVAIAALAQMDQGPNLTTAEKDQIAMRAGTYRKECSTSHQELVRLRGLAALFTTPDTFKCLNEFLAHPYVAVFDRQPDKIKELAALHLRLNHWIITLARKDLGIVI